MVWQIIQLTGIPNGSIDDIYDGSTNVCYSGIVDGKSQPSVFTRDDYGGTGEFWSVHLAWKSLTVGNFVPVVDEGGKKYAICKCACDSGRLFAFDMLTMRNGVNQILQLCKREKAFKHESVETLHATILVLYAKIVEMEEETTALHNTIRLLRSEATVQNLAVRVLATAPPEILDDPS